MGNKFVTFSALILVIFGFIMIASAEMGNSVGDTGYLSRIILRQIIYAAFGVGLYFLFMNIRVFRFRLPFFYFGYAVILFALFACRLFGQINGAYAWIRLPGGATIQPSEFAKAFMILFGAKLLGRDHGEENDKFKKIYIICSSAYFLIIWLVQKDFGSAVVFFCVCFCILLIPPYKEYKKLQKWMSISVFAAIAGILLVLSPLFTKWMMKYSDNYMIGRFLAAANPFLYRYDNGYHIIMSLVSFASGNIFGLGYGNSIHKYMNFPNPSNDFIVPVMVEEFGIVGFVVLMLLYFALLVPLMLGSIKVKYLSSKMILLGTFLYFVVHFILNIGGVSALIPLTGVPLLLISSGGSSLVASMIALGFSQAELIWNRNLDEDNSRQIQENTN